MLINYPLLGTQQAFLMIDLDQQSLKLSSQTVYQGVLDGGELPPSVFLRRAIHVYTKPVECIENASKMSSGKAHSNRLASALPGAH